MQAFFTSLNWRTHWLYNIAIELLSVLFSHTDQSAGFTFEHVVFVAFGKLT